MYTLVDSRTYTDARWVRVLPYVRDRNSNSIGREVTKGDCGETYRIALSLARMISVSLVRLRRASEWGRHAYAQPIALRQRRARVCMTRCGMARTHACMCVQAVTGSGSSSLFDQNGTSTLSLSLSLSLDCNSCTPCLLKRDDCMSKCKQGRRKGKKPQKTTKSTIQNTKARFYWCKILISVWLIVYRLL